MTKTPKNGSASSTPTPGGGGGPASTGAPPSVGSTKSEPAENDVTSHDSIANRSGTPHSLPENTSKETNEESTAVNGAANNATSSAATDPGLLCDNVPDGSSVPGSGENTNADGNADNNDAGGAQVKHEVKHEDVKPNLGSNCSTPIHQQGQNAALPTDTDFLDGFDSKDGVKDEADESDIPPLTDFKDEDLIDFPNDSNFYQGPASSGPGFAGPPPGSMGIMSTCSSSVAPQTQPLPSNVLGKGGDRNLDQQYMQQSSQIFVFSTDWANRSANAVMSQEYLSIISWHESQPETKKQLDEMTQRYPQMAKTIMNQQNMRMSQMNKMMKGPKGQPMMPPGMRPPMGPGMMQGPMGGPMDKMGPGPGMMGGPMGPRMDSEDGPMDPSHVPSSLSGSKIPNENLNPEQRKKRAEKLAVLSKLNSQLFPTGGGPPGGNFPPGGNIPPGQSSPMNGPPGGCMPPMGPGNGPPPPGAQGGFGPRGNMMGPNMGPRSFPPNRPMGPNGPMHMGPRGMMDPGGRMMMDPRMMDPRMMDPRMMDPRMMMPPGMMGPNGPMGPGQGMMPGGPPFPPNSGPGGMMGPGGPMPPGGGPGGMMGPGMPPMGMMGPGGGPMDGPPTSIEAQMNWQKMQHQYMQEKTKKGGQGGPSMGPRGMMGPGGNRMPGPPPPYPQGPGPRGIPPGAMASPNPGSPATSLPMSSPAQGIMNSPRHMGSNPGTPVSCAPMSSPVTGPRNSPGIPPQNNPQDNMFNRQMQYGGSTKNPQSSNKEANLMPVPSPQQIQYLNPMEGQELTIQKQPNTSLRDQDLLSPSMPGSTTPQPDMSKGPNTPSASVGGGPLTPSSGMGDSQMPPKYTGPNTPNTPNSVHDMNFPVPSPSQNLDKQQRMTPGPPTSSADNNTTNKFPAPSPGATGPRTPMDSSNNRFPVPSPQMGAGGGPPRFPGPGGMSPMHDAPLNPSAPGSAMGKGFDPITSMAQMSQQLTDNVPSSAGNPNLCNMDAGMMSMGQRPNGMMDMMGSPHDMGMGPGGPGGPMGPGGPSGPPGGPMGGPPMMRPGFPPHPNMMGPDNRMVVPNSCDTSTNPTFATVKPSTPNTIQYLPTRPGPQYDNRPRGPPSLDFLQRYSNPDKNGPPGNMDGGPGGPPPHMMNMMPMGSPGMNMGGPPQRMNMMRGPGPNGPPGGGRMRGPPPPGPMMGPGGGPPMGPGGPMGGFPGGPGGPPGGPGGPFPGGPDNRMMGPGGPPGGPGNMGMNMYGGPNDMMGPGGPGNMGSPINNSMGMGPNGNASMGMGSPVGNMGGPKHSPMGNDHMPPGGNMSCSTAGPPGGPPQPPGGGNFKNSPIIGSGPTTTDPNYAQQFHDFQQQLYATNTRSSQMRGSGGGGPPGPPGPPHGMPPMSQGNFYAGPGSGPMSSSAK